MFGRGVHSVERDTHKTCHSELAVPKESNLVLRDGESTSYTNSDNKSLINICRVIVGGASLPRLFRLNAQNAENEIARCVSDRNATFLFRNGIIFPEGTRSTDGTLGEIKKGASFIIHHSEVPVIPVFLKGAERFMPRGAKFIRPAKLSVTFGPPIDFTGLKGRDRRQELYQRMSEQIRQAILALAEDLC